MFVPSNSDEGDLVSRPAAGLVAGAIGALAMLAVVALAQGTSGVETWLARFGLWVHVIVGALLGALHSACQQRTAVRGLIAVGLFYGFLIWLVAGLILGWFGVASPLSTWWPGLPANLTFGLVLATWAAIAQQLSSGMPAHARPVD